VHDVLLEIVEQGRPFIAGILGERGDAEMVDLIQAAIWGLQLQQLFLRRGRARVRAVVERLLDQIDGPKKDTRPARAKRKGGAS